MKTDNPFREWRDERKFGPAEAAKEVGVQRQTWWRWEHGHSRVDIDILDKVETVTGIPRQRLRPDIFGEVA